MRYEVLTGMDGVSVERDVAATMRDELGGIDVLVNNAGTMPAFRVGFRIRRSCGRDKRLHRLQCLGLDLANTLTSDTELSTNFFKCAASTVF